MKKIELQAIITGEKLDHIALGKQLFPGAKRPDMALARLLTDPEVHLKADQIERLCAISGLTPSQVFAYQNGWTNKGAAQGVTIFEKGSYTATLDSSTGVTTLTHKDSLYSEDFLGVQSLSVSEYVNFLNNQILKLESKC